MKKSFAVTRPVAVGPPADGIFPKEPFVNVMLFCTLAMAVP